MADGVKVFQDVNAIDDDSFSVASYFTDDSRPRYQPPPPPPGRMRSRAPAPKIEPLKVDGKTPPVLHSLEYIGAYNRLLSGQYFPSAA